MLQEFRVTNMLFVLQSLNDNCFRLYFRNTLCFATGKAAEREISAAAFSFAFSLSPSVVVWRDKRRFNLALTNFVSSSLAFFSTQ
jgi:hypothetical protein